MDNLLKVQSDNWRDNGGDGGVSTETMDDIGYTSWDQVADIIASGQNTPEHERPQNMKIAEVSGKIVCGDCAQVLPCEHGTGKRTIGN